MRGVKQRLGPRRLTCWQADLGLNLLLSRRSRGAVEVCDGIGAVGSAQALVRTRGGQWNFWGRAISKVTLSDCSKRTNDGGEEDKDTASLPQWPREVPGQGAGSSSDAAESRQGIRWTTPPSLVRRHPAASPVSFARVVVWRTTSIFEERSPTASRGVTWKRVWAQGRVAKAGDNALALILAGVHQDWRVYRSAPARCGGVGIILATCALGRR
jgi:hypothetical protein